MRNNRKLYESIMKDVAKIVKKHLLVETEINELFGFGKKKKENKKEDNKKEVSLVDEIKDLIEPLYKVNLYTKPGTYGKWIPINIYGTLHDKKFSKDFYIEYSDRNLDKIDDIKNYVKTKLKGDVQASKVSTYNEIMGK